MKKIKIKTEEEQREGEVFKEIKVLNHLYMNQSKTHTDNCPAKNSTNELACRCDSFHTFDELYEHRIILFIALCRNLAKFYNQGEGLRYQIWCSTKHSDGLTFGDQFILGIGKEKGKQLTYHLSPRYWNEVCEFAQVLKKAPEFDEHTSEDVLERLKDL